MLEEFLNELFAKSAIYTELLNTLTKKAANKCISYKTDIFLLVKLSGLKTLVWFRKISSGFREDSSIMRPSRKHFMFSLIILKLFWLYMNCQYFWKYI